MEEALLHAAERTLQRQRRGGAPGAARVVPGAHVQQPAARRQAEPDAGEAEGLPVLGLRRAGRSRPRVVTVEARPPGSLPVPEHRWCLGSPCTVSPTSMDGKSVTSP